MDVKFRLCDFDDLDEPVECNVSEGGVCEGHFTPSVPRQMVSTVGCDAVAEFEVGFLSYVRIPTRVPRISSVAPDELPRGTTGQGKVCDPKSGQVVNAMVSIPYVDTVEIRGENLDLVTSASFGKGIDCRMIERARGFMRCSVAVWGPSVLGMTKEQAERVAGGAPLGQHDVKVFQLQPFRVNAKIGGLSIVEGGPPALSGISLWQPAVETACAELRLTGTGFWRPSVQVGPQNLRDFSPVEVAANSSPDQEHLNLRLLHTGDRKRYVPITCSTAFGGFVDSIPPENHALPAGQDRNCQWMEQSQDHAGRFGLLGSGFGKTWPV